MIRGTVASERSDSLSTVDCPPLWATAQRVARFRRAWRADDSAAITMLRRADDLLARTGDSVDIGAAMVRWLCDGDASTVNAAVDQAVARAGQSSQANLTLAAWALDATLLADVCWSALGSERRSALLGTIGTLIDRQLDVADHQGNPHSIKSNHWAVNHGSIHAAAVLLHRHAQSGDATSAQLHERIQWSGQRLAAYLSLLGDRGYGHEGIGYLMYTMSFVLPAALASAASDVPNLIDRWPGFQRLAASLFITATARPPSEASNDEAFGSKLNWNDDGPIWPGGESTPVLAMNLAPGPRQPALRRVYDRLHGLDGFGRFNAAGRGLIFNALFYPFDGPTESTEAADAALPHHVFDARQGLSIFRNRYRDGDDAVAGLYAKVFFPGGHEQNDAGSVRLSALGHDWIVGGGQARPDRQWQSVVCSADGSHGDQATGLVLWDEPTDGGGTVGCDVRNVSDAYHERWMSVAFDHVGDCDVALALLDLVDDHLGRPWAWHMTFSAKLRYQADEDGHGFTLTGPAGEVMHTRFCAALPKQLELRHTPASTRRFQSRGETHYPPRPFVRAVFSPQPHLGIYAAMAIRRGPCPEVHRGDAMDLLINGTPWRRPFGMALAADFDPLQAGGTCRFPTGRSTTPR